MENLQEKMKYLTNFGQKVYAVEFKQQMYFIVESGKVQTGIGDRQKDYTLFNEQGQQMGYLHLARLLMSKVDIMLEKADGVLVVPDDFFYLSDIEISKGELRGKGLGSMLLNWATKEMQQISAEKGATIPLLLIRQNSQEAPAFYKKWGAVLNQEVEDNKPGSSCYMRIDNPTPKPEYDVKVVAQYEKTTEKKEDKHK